jgi:2-hydroxycyclohexanecarboxyl-CoA dehydrogenase
MRFTNKVAIITGGSEGMGKAAAIGFAREGASVVITSRSQEKLEAAAKEIRSFGGKVTVVPGDIMKDDDIYAVVNKTLSEYGKVDILFNYAGGSPDLKPVSLFIEQDKAFWDQMIRFNLWSTMIFCRAVIDPMMKQKYGKIVNTAAMAGKVGATTMAAYAAAKGGVIAFTKALAQEMVPYNINVNCVCPGPIATPGAVKVIGAMMKSAAASGAGPKDPPPGKPGVMNRMGTPWEVASAVLYLASDDAAFINGQPLSVDGGGSMV